MAYARAAEARADRLRAVTQLQNAGTRLEEQWRKEQEIVAADERDFDLILRAERALEVLRRIKSAEPAAEDEDVTSC